VVPLRKLGYREIPGSQEVALWRTNIFRDSNDVSIKRILDHLRDQGTDPAELLAKIRKDRFC